MYNQQIAQKIKSLIAAKDPTAEVILFGSQARGLARADSDWDILILLNKPMTSRAQEREYRDELFALELEIGQPISTFVFSKSEWEDKHAITPLYQNIKQEGVRL